MRSALVLSCILLSGCAGLRVFATKQGDKAVGGVATRMFNSQAEKLEALAAEEQDPETKQAMLDVAQENREFSARLAAHAAELEARGEEMPWLKALGANWLEALLSIGVLALGGFSWRKRAQLRTMLKSGKHKDALLLVVKDAIGRFLTDNADNGAANALKNELNEAVARSPDLGAGGVREHIDRTVNGET